MIKIVIRCDGGREPEIGTGHVSRMLNLARGLNNKKIVKKKEINFLIRRKRNFSFGYKMVKNSKFKIIKTHDSNLIPNSNKEADIISKTFCKTVIFDRLKTSEKLIRQIKKNGKKVITFDDIGKGRKFSDISINEILKDKNRKANFKNLILGTKNKFFKNKFNYSKKSLFVCFGGYDHKNFTIKFLKIIDKIKSFKNIFVIISNFKREKIKIMNNLINKKGCNKKILLLNRPNNFYEIMSKSNLAIVSGGLLVFECALFGIPSIVIPQYSHQMKTIKNLSKLKFTLPGIKGTRDNFKGIPKKIDDLKNNKKKLLKMSHLGRQYVDGKGLERVLIKVKKVIK